MSVVNYTHHGRDVSVVSKYKGKHKEICMCHQGCKRFKPGQGNLNCFYAQDAYGTSLDIGLALIMECDRFEKEDDNA